MTSFKFQFYLYPWYTFDEPNIHIIPTKDRKNLWYGVPKWLKIFQRVKFDLFFYWRKRIFVQTRKFQGISISWPKCPLIFWSYKFYYTDQLKISQPPDFLTVLHNSTGNFRRVIWESQIRTTNQSHVTFKDPMTVFLEMQKESLWTMVPVVNARLTLATFFAIRDFSSMLIGITKKMTFRNVHENWVSITFTFKVKWDVR